jgi:hypothetical protein
MQNTFTTMFDTELTAKLKHLNNYPQMLPYIGVRWTEQSKRILLLAESHYIPGDELSGLNTQKETHLTDWYNNNSSKFYQGLSDYISTRDVVQKADNPAEKGTAKPLTIYYNIKTELKKHIPHLKDENQIFPFFSVYNYFQRPHFKSGGSINNTAEDNEVAYQTLKTVIEIINPTQVIFVSTKARKSFIAKFNKDLDKSCFNNINIDGVPHASSQWWNRKSAAYSNRTGREKFISLITKN